jgi:hypothetical protein
MSRSINYGGSEGLAAEIADVHTLLFTDLHRVETRRLAAHCVHSGRGHFDIFPVSKQSTKKPFRDGAAANISGTDKKDAFHDTSHASERESNLGLNRAKSICRLCLPGGQETAVP